MPKNNQTTTVREWCNSLGVLTAISVDSEDARLRLAAFVPLLADRFPAAAFTTASLEAVARECVKGFPSYGELAEHLAAWWKAHRPPIAALPPPELPPPRPDATPEERAAVRARVEECIAALRSSRIEIDAQSRRLDDVAAAPRPRYLTPEQLDRINPLPNGRKRTDAASPAAPLVPDAPADASAAAAGPPSAV